MIIIQRHSNKARPGGHACNASPPEAVGFQVPSQPGLLVRPCFKIEKKKNKRRKEGKRKEGRKEGKKEGRKEIQINSKIDLSNQFLPSRRYDFMHYILLPSGC
jgi:hypothetical protein